MSIPNILTVVRILLTPVFVIMLLQQSYSQALLVFAVAGLSDALDGFIARYFNQRTVLGAYLDPVADKLLLVSAYVILGMLDVFPDWIAVIVIARDVIIVLGIAIIALTSKSYEVRPSLVSKATTLTQIVLVLLCLFDPAAAKLPSLHTPLVWGTAVLTTLSGLHYIFIGMNILQENNEKTD
ncbi:MAG: CDP-diacylglycerol--glycerol-3-phosphate 3-phosphatidyltransferase [Desulfatitalea sp.]|nr:CDP-diacylglycerol--glycerol-3-phosphate 3-phosphatidyltransferase [Desulfatitalea sp.]